MNLATLSPSQNCRTTEISDSSRTSSLVPTSSPASPSISSAATSSINTTSDPTNIASSSSNSSSNEPSIQNGKLSPPVASASLLDRQTMLLTAVTACSSRSRDPVEYSKEVADALKHCHCSKVAPLANGIIPNGKFDKNKSPSDCISPEVCKRLLSLSEDMNLLVRNITKEAKALVQAEICSLFLLDKENSELVAEVFEKNGTSDEYLTEIRMPLNQGIVGHVATTGEMMNVQNVYE
uniref:Uncharacterized protein n=1 Tax=Panagrolaimus superbus TaxID=310955 RepID=A0A914YSU4_9BILA